jgi:DNA-binding NtrC family response regulator
MAERIEKVIDRLRDTLARAKLIGEAPAFLQALWTLPAIAGHDGTVLITGESGTGKELVARAIHYQSGRAGHPFVCVNCGSLPDLLVEDALFGHEAGAFTDARSRRIGLLGEADRGSLFLDEVESLSARAQATLLRVLQDGMFYALGSTRQQRTDLRLIAASNVPLGAMLKAGSFRPDLYHRLRVFLIDLPPLRERRPDILMLASHFLVKHSPSHGRRLQFSDAARSAMCAYPWPGNVRELENAVLRASVLSQGCVIEVDDLGLAHADVASSGSRARATARSASYQVLKRELITTFEHDYLVDLMTEHGGNVTHAARTAGKDRRELGKLLRKHGLDARAFRSARA